MAWLYVLFAAIVEVFWVIGLRYSETFWQWTGTTIMIICSFYFIIKACEKLPSGTVYAVFTGSGAAAIVMLDFFMFDANFSAIQVMFLGLIIIGVVGVKMTSGEEQVEGGS